MRAVELYAGAGGLALGASLAGFKPLAVVEWDRWACDTIRENQRRGHPLVADWPLHEGDVRAFDWSTIPEDIELLAGGPPCQPFSLAGKHRAHDDHRDMFPPTVEIVRRLRPKAFILENVKGLTRSSFANYYQYILLQLEFPEVARRPMEGWSDHFARLQVERASGRAHGRDLTYHVVPTLVNAADYGIPQRRERVFIVGFRADLGIEWSFPLPTHGQDGLLYDQWVGGDYWERHGVPSRHRPAMPANVARRVARLRESLFPPAERPWRTVRDALFDLPDPESASADAIPNHRFQPGARPYPGHTGSPLDLPAKTLKAGDHGVPGGENMLLRPDGSTRYFTLRESARLQTFPDGYLMHGAWSEAMRQLGNAVPVALGHLVAGGVAERLILAELAALARQRAGRRAAA